MKVAIIGMPRSASTVLFGVISKNLQLVRYNEPYEGLYDLSKAYDYSHRGLNQIHSGAFKLMAHNFYWVNWQAVNWYDFNEIIFTHRNNHADACISVQYAAMFNYWRQTKLRRFNLDLTPFTITDQQITDYVNNFVHYCEMKKNISGIRKTECITYEQIVSGEYVNKIKNVFNLQNVDTDIDDLPLGVNYRQLCLNYDEVVDKIDGGLETHERI